MKKTIAFLLLLALIAACMAGCSSERRLIEFRKNVEKLGNEALTNVQLLSTFLNLEKTYISVENIEDDQHAEEIVYSGMKQYDGIVENLRKKGENADIVTIEAIGERWKVIQDLYKKIENDAESRKAEPELFKNATLLYLDCSVLMGMITAPYGPADEFEKHYSGVVDQAMEAAQTIAELLYVK